MDQVYGKRLLRVCNVLLRTASFIVPSQQRADWLRDKGSEVFHWVHFLAESERLTLAAQQEVLKHAWGAFPDALWRRFNRDAVLKFVHTFPPSASFCLLSISVALVVLFAAKPIPLPSHPSAMVNSESLLTVVLNDKSRWLEPELLDDAATEWSRNSRLIAETATYAWRQNFIRGPYENSEVVSARVTPDMFQVLGIKPVLGRTFDPTSARECTECIVITNALWQMHFRSDPRVIGTRVFLHRQQVEIIGVLPPEFQFPGIDIGVFGPFEDEFSGRMPGWEWPGVVIRLAAGASTDQTKAQIQKLVNETGFPSPAVLDVLSLKDIHYRSMASWLRMTLFAVVVLIAFNLRAFARLCARAPRRTLPQLCRWWLFFAVKGALLVAIAWVVSVDVGRLGMHLFGGQMQPFAGGVRMWFFFTGMTIALTWSIRDQGARCRTCLRRLQTQVFLGASFGPLHGPSGFELVCDSGHGVLHIPFTSLSCLDSEQWTEFDESWRELAQGA